MNGRQTRRETWRDKKTRQLHAELARLRELAGEQPAARPARRPRPGDGSGQ